MFGDLPKIFERNFVVGYVLPSALFLLLSLGFTHHADLRGLLTTSDGASFAILAFASGVVLLAVNRTITRILEGYGKLNPARLMTWFQRWRFRRLHRKLNAANEEYLKYGQPEEIPKKLEQLREYLMTRLVERYPHDESLVLPTSFGNCVRAFESYPIVMYKLEIIESWTRLVAVIPKGYLDLIDAAKADTDLWINLWFLSLMTIADAILTWSYIDPAGRKAYLAPLLDHITTDLRPYSQPLLTSVGALSLALSASWMAARAAIEWGSTFKAAVDVYLPALYDRLRFPAAANWEDLRNRWDAFSDSVSYRRPDLMQVARSRSPIENPAPAAAIIKAVPAKPTVAPVKRFALIAYMNAKATSILVRVKASMRRLRKYVTLTPNAEQKGAVTESTQNNGVAGQSTAPQIPTHDSGRASSEDPREET